ncbi:MAG: hypothetical protein GF331_14185 [Chitinivibrionales bacterium]|nr:hypothetical protein [Chitinivibrionales bacterium]
MHRVISVVTACAVMAGLVSATPYPGAIGVNLGNVPFVDMVKATAGYTNLSGASMSESDFDAAGWPQRDFRLLLLDSRPATEWSGTIDDPEEYRVDYSGVYKGSFTGQANVSVLYTHGSVSNVQYDAGSNSTTFDLTLPSPGTGYCFTVMQFSNTKRTSGSATNSGITDLKIIRPGYGTNPTRVVTDEFMSTLTYAGFSAIRAGGLTGTGMMPVTYPDRTVWSNRKQLTDASWRRHAGKLDNAPWEVFIDICNEAGMDLWANIPISADTMYIRELATLLHQRLNSDRNVYIEIDNEVWGFDQPKNYNDAEATALGLANPLMNLAQRITFAARTFESVFGAGSLTNRVRPVLAWWISRRMDVNNMLNYINGNYGTVGDIIYAVAPAMYFSVGADMENETNASQHRLVMGMFDDIRNQFANRSQWVNTTATWDLKGGMICYEGGPHTPSANFSSAPNLATKITMHRTEHMPAQMLYNMREAFFELGATLFMSFTLSSSYNRYGCWGFTDDLSIPDRNFKFRAIRELTGDVTTPLPPGRFWAHIDNGSTITLTWDDHADNETGFVVELHDSATGALIGAPDTLPANTVTMTDEGLASTSDIYYTLRAYNAVGHSTYTLAFPTTEVAVRPRAEGKPVQQHAAAALGDSPRQVVVYTLSGKRILTTDRRGLAGLASVLPAGMHVVEIRGARGVRRSSVMGLGRSGARYPIR